MKYIDSSPERTALQRIARQYSKEGYKVIVQPSAEDRPDKLRGFAIDLLATRGDETVVIEVKRSTSEKPDPQLERLTELVSQLPNYRLDFVSMAKPQRPNRDDWLSTHEIRHLINEGLLLIKAESFEAATLLLWSAAEAILRLLADREGIKANVHTPLLMVKNLYSQGVLQKDEYTLLVKIIQFRNAAVHGYRIEQKDDKLLHDMSNLTHRLLNRI